MSQPSLGFVIVFLIFSLLFFSNTYKLWFKTDEYYQSIYNSLTWTAVPVPVQGLLPQAAGKPQMLGSGAKDL